MRSHPKNMGKLGKHYPPLALWGLTLLGLGIVVFCFVAIINIPLRLLFGPPGVLKDLAWWAGSPVVAGFVLILIDLIFIYARRRRGHTLSSESIDTSQVTVVLTAYNDEKSIGLAVRDFGHVCC